MVHFLFITIRSLNFSIHLPKWLHLHCKFYRDIILFFKAVFFIRHELCMAHCQTDWHSALKWMLQKAVDSQSNKNLIPMTLHFVVIMLSWNKTRLLSPLHEFQLLTVLNTIWVDFILAKIHSNNKIPILNVAQINWIFFEYFTQFTSLYEPGRVKKEPSPTFQTERDSCLDFFNKWNESDQVDFVEQLLARMCHYQHGHINAYLKPMLQRDFISLLPSKCLWLSMFCD